jgi:hypothetical protein
MGTYDMVKDSFKTLKKLSEIELHRKILDLQEEVISLLERLKEAEGLNSSLKDRFKFKATLTLDQPFYFADGEKFPYCVHCWDNDQKAIHPQKIRPRTNLWVCGNCKQGVSATMEQIQRMKESE